MAGLSAICRILDKSVPPLLLVALLLHAGTAPAQQTALPAQPEITLKINGQSLAAEVVNVDETRQRGLMFRKTMAENHGMLFVFPESAFHSMWMQNTYLPLSVAFIDDAGVILNIADMQPLTTDSHTAAGFARYALEMNQGWFAKRGIKAGAKIEGLGKAPRPR